MSAPYIKMYLLPAGYTQASDNDVQQRVDDELLPAYIKQPQLSTVMPTTGVSPVINQVCHPIVFPPTQTTSTMTASSATQFTVAGGTLPNVLIPPSGAYSPYIVDASGYTIPPSGYQIVANPANLTEFASVVFYNAPANQAPTKQPFTLHYYERATGNTAHWILPYPNPYQGTNDAINKLIVDPSGTGNPTYEGVLYIPTPSGSQNELFQIPVAASGVIANYWYTTPNTQWFAGNHCNWIAGHILMSPDIFVGSEDYPGDSGTINGVPITQGVVPEYVSNGTYSVDYRMGLVRFPQVINSTLTPVQANYSYLVGINNVTNQKLDFITSQALAVWETPVAASGSQFYFDIILDGSTHQVAFYCYDDTGGRNQTIDILAGPSGNVVFATANITNFTTGKYAVFSASGHIHARVTTQNAHTGVVSGVFFDPTGVIGVSFIDIDSSTTGQQWWTEYGQDGRELDQTNNTTNQLPSYASLLSPSGDTYIDPWYTGSNTNYIQNNLTQFQAISEVVFPLSHGQPWINRNNIHTPRNTYVNGVLTGQPITVEPFDILTIKTS